MELNKKRWLIIGSVSLIALSITALIFKDKIANWFGGKADDTANKGAGSDSTGTGFTPPTLVSSGSGTPIITNTGGGTTNTTTNTGNNPKLTGGNVGDNKPKPTNTKTGTQLVNVDFSAGRRIYSNYPKTNVYKAGANPRVISRVVNNGGLIGTGLKQPTNMGIIYLKDGTEYVMQDDVYVFV